MSNFKNEGSGSERQPLTRLGGLYNSRSGNALTGNINLNYVNRGTGQRLGETLIEEIQKAMEMNHAWRLLVFENNGKFQQRAPYSIHSCISDRPNRDRSEQEQERQEKPFNDGFARGLTPPLSPASDESLPQAPRRRTAPRR